MSTADAEPDVLKHAAGIIGELPRAVGHRARRIAQPEPPARWGSGTGAPVVLVPGVYETWHFLEAVGDALNAAGHPVHTVPALGTNHRPIPDAARAVWRRILDLDLDQVTLVAHSKGGLIGKHVLAYDDVEGRVVRLVTVATPFRGSTMAYFAPPGALREFRPDNATIRVLRTETDVNAFITSIAPVADDHIPEGSELLGARNVTLPAEGHFRILDDPRLPPLVVNEVERLAP